jgi:para-nitrobenzyl esterase
MQPIVRRAVLAALVVATFHLSPSATRADDPPAPVVDVTLRSGAVLHGEVNQERSMREWRGIPYAEPPVGALRWMPPVPRTLTGDIDATRFGHRCTQPGDPESQEDCLYLNVSAPLDSKEGDDLAVIVDIHGGANAFGSAREDTGGWVKHDVIVVTLNYRLGALGVFAHPALTAAGTGATNFALRDQITALTWVRDNISSFGGDPGKVTISGFSTGGGYVITLQAVPRAADLFVRAIPSSFFVNMVTNQWRHLADHEQSGIALAQIFGCPSDEQPDVMDCMRDRPADELAAVWWDIGAGGDAGIVDGDWLPRPVIEYLADNPSVPTLIGHAREEAFGDWIFDPATPDPMSPGEYTRWSNDITLSSIAARFRKFYTADGYGTLRTALLYFWTDFVNTCPTRRVALAVADRAPTYRYMSTHILENEPYFHYARAAHGSDVTLIYDELWYPQTPAEAALSGQMTAYFTNFAKTGDPNGPGLPAWSPFTRDAESYMEFADTSIPRTGGYHAEQCPIVDGAPLFPVCGSLCKWFTHKNMPAPLQKLFGFFKLPVCHGGETVEILGRHLDDHLEHGDEYGACIVPASLPGRIEAEDYAYGGEGVAYHDLDPGNNGGEYRIDDVDVRRKLSGGYQVGWIETGEWLEYDVVATETGVYTVTLQIASGCCGDPKIVHLEIDGAPAGEPASFDFAWSWDLLHDVVIADVPMTAGPHRLRVAFDVGPLDLDGMDVALQE